MPTMFKDVTDSGATKLVDAPTSGFRRRIRVTGALLIAAADTTVYFTSGSDQTQISASFPLAANSGFVLPNSAATAAEGWMQTNPGECLGIHSSVATLIGVQLSWQLG
jgi:hypothetical protein